MVPDEYEEEETEVRQDLDGEWYTKDEFIEEYGGTKEWDRATRSSTSL